jgi:membrane associated rhomboid family serine protease
MLVFAAVVLGLVLRGMSSEERVHFGQAVLSYLVFVKNAITKPPAGSESFHAALKARTRWAIVTPAIVLAYVATFLLAAMADGSVSDPRTLAAWGSNIGPRTTNGEWWRLVTAMFLHVGVVHLVADVAGLLQAGLVAERLVGRLAFVVVFAAAGVLAGVWNLTLHPVSIHAGAAGAIYGVYGLLLASLVLGLLLRSAFAIPLGVLKGLWPGIALFTLYDALTAGVINEAMEAGLIVGFTGGMAVGGRVITDKPPVRRVCAVSAATLAIIVSLAAPLRGLADVAGEVDRVRAAEARTAESYDAAVVRFKAGRIKAQELATLADKFVGELELLHARLSSIENVPAGHWPMVSKASEYLKLRQDSWRLRAEGLRAGHTKTLQEADAAEHAALAALDDATAPIQQ